MLPTFYDSNTVVARVCTVFNTDFLPKIEKNPLLILQIKHTPFSLFTPYQNLIYPKAMARIFISVPFMFYCAVLSFAFCSAISAFLSFISMASFSSHSSLVGAYMFLAIRLP